jgi:hypothetical protein
MRTTKKLFAMHRRTRYCFKIIIFIQGVEGRKNFVVRGETNAHQTRVFAVHFLFDVGPIKTHGKESVYRAPEIKRMAMNLTHGSIVYI